jgi:hypothetical protein
MPTCTSLGCFADNVNMTRALPVKVTTIPVGSMTVEACQAACFGSGYPYFGLEFGQECWCGQVAPNEGASNQCTFPCTGNSAETCGGPSALSVYACLS